MLHVSSSFLLHSYFPNHVPKEEELDFLDGFLADCAFDGTGGLPFVLLLVTLLSSTRGLLDDALLCFSAVFGVLA